MNEVSGEAVYVDLRQHNFDDRITAFFDIIADILPIITLIITSIRLNQLQLKMNFNSIEI